MIVLKIIMGLGQVLSKQPEVVKQDFPGPQWCANLASRGAQTAS